MLYNLYLLFAMLTSQLEMMTFSIKTLNDTSHTGLKGTVNQTRNWSSGVKNLSSSLYSQYELSDFTSSARRVSEKKCMEYIYEMLKRQEKVDKSDSKDVTIINGKVVEAAEYPHMGALGWWSYSEHKLVFLCGASLISDNFMLTAAHCTHVVRQGLSNHSPHMVRLGTRYLTMSPYESPKDVNIRNLITHPCYHSPIKYYDIALVKLDEKVAFSKFIQPACLSSVEYDTSQGKQITATGWGSVNGKKYASPSTVLRYGVVDIFNDDKCAFLLNRYRYRFWMGLKSHQMCAGQIDGSTDTCQGDSGGPLQYMLLNTSSEGTIHRMLSVTAFGLTNCASKNAPGVYTKVSSFINWIEYNVWPYKSNE